MWKEWKEKVKFNHNGKTKIKTEEVVITKENEV